MIDRKDSLFDLRNHRSLIIIIVPVYNEQDNIVILYDNIRKLFTEQLNTFAWKIRFVNDGSSDHSWEVIKNLATEDSEHVCGVNLSKNFGKEVALTAGIEAGEDGDAIICIDADMQHPPSLIPEFIRQWKNGYEIVIGIRQSVSDYSILKRIGSKLFYFILKKCSDINIHPNSTDFRLIDKNVVSNFKRMPERNRIFRGLIDWLGFRKSYVHFCAGPRCNGGPPSYSYKKLFRLAVNSITSFSLLPLRMTGYLGLMVSMLSSFLMAYMFLTDFVQFAEYTPQAYFIVFNTLLTGVMLSGMGMLALYIGNIHTEVVGRPLYVIKEMILSKSGNGSGKRELLLDDPQNYIQKSAIN